MAHFVVVSGNKKENLACTVRPFAADLRLPPVKTGGWGLGYYDSGTVLLRVEPREESRAFDIAEKVSSIETYIFMMHTREATVGQVKRNNTHPFKFQNWMLVHNGTFEGFDKYRNKVRAAMPPYILRGLDGDTDSQSLFCLFLSCLHDAGKLNRLDPGTEAIRGALGQAIATMDTYSVEAHGPRDLDIMSVSVTDGYSVVSLARGCDVNYALVEGVKDCEVCRGSISPGARDGRTDHGSLRAVVIRGGKTDGLGPAFEKLADRTFLSVTSDQKIEFDEFA